MRGEERRGKEGEEREGKEREGNEGMSHIQYLKSEFMNSQIEVPKESRSG